MDGTDAFEDQQHTKAAERQMEILPAGVGNPRLAREQAERRAREQAEQERRVQEEQRAREQAEQERRAREEA